MKIGIAESEFWDFKKICQVDSHWGGGGELLLPKKQCKVGVDESSAEELSVQCSNVGLSTALMYGSVY